MNSWFQSFASGFISGLSCVVVMWIRTQDLKRDIQQMQNVCQRSREAFTKRIDRLQNAKTP